MKTYKLVVVGAGKPGTPVPSPTNTGVTRDNPGQFDPRRKSKDYLKVYIMAELTDASLDSLIKMRTNTLVKKPCSPFCPHLTLMSFFIHKDNANVINQEFAEKIHSLYNYKLSTLNLTSNPSIRGNYNILGARDKFFVREYQQSDNIKMEQFRNGVIDLLKTKLSVESRSYFLGDDNGKIEEMTVLSSRKSSDKPGTSSGPNEDRTIVFIPEIYRPESQWRPHFTIVSKNDINNSNEELRQNLEGKSDDVWKTIIFKEFCKKKLSALPNNIKLSESLNKIKVSITTNPTSNYTI